MVEHKAKIVDKKKLSDGAIAFCARCCGDPATDSWHTLYVVNDVVVARALDAQPGAETGQHVPADGVDRDHIRQELDNHKARVEALHAGASAVESILDEFVDKE